MLFAYKVTRNIFLGEKLEREDVDILIKECCDAEDGDGFIPYERKNIKKIFNNEY